MRGKSHTQLSIYTGAYSHYNHLWDRIGVWYGIYKLLRTTQLESGDWRKKNHDLTPKLVIYGLTRSFSHASHQCGHDSLTTIAVYEFRCQVVALFLQLSLSSCVVCKSLYKLHQLAIHLLQYIQRQERCTIIYLARRLMHMHLLAAH